MWVITRAVNEYDQFGEYLEVVFETRPTKSEIIRSLGCANSLALHVWNGGGRRESEDVWFYLTELKHGEQYKHRNGYER